MRLLVCGIATFFFAAAGVAQERTMSLAEVMSAADSSVRLRASLAAVDAAHSRQEAAHDGSYLPDVRLSAAVGYLGDGHGWGRDSSYSFTVAMPHLSTRFAIEARQVVYGGGALQSARRQAEHGARLSELDHQRQRQDVRMQIAALYADLFRSRQRLAVIDSNIALSRRMIADIEAKLGQGVALRNDRTRYELQLSRLEMQRTTVENDMAIANGQLLVLAGLEPTVRVCPDDSFLGVAVTDATEAPVGVQAAGTAEQMAAEKVRESGAARLPQVAIVAQDELNGPVTIDITPYDINYNYWFVGVALSYDLSSLWKGNNGVRAARAELRQRRMERAEAELECDEALRSAQLRLDEARSNLVLKQKSQELAEQNYRLVANRYANEMALLVDMLDAANLKLEAELDLIDARIGVAFNILKINYLKGVL